MLPTVDFCGHAISRLIVGGNPVSGTSHVSAAMDAEMEDWFTTRRVKELLFRCQEAGINTFQFRGDKHILRIIREFRLEGGRMNWIAQSAREMDFDENVEFMAAYRPALIYHHGYVTDDLFLAGEFDEIRRRLGVIRKTGVPAGLCTHMPQVVEYAETHGWDADFYMCSVYNIRVPERRTQSDLDGNEDALFVDSDIPVMYQTIRSTDKPCLVFKILGATRRCRTQEDVAGAFRECFHNIKAGDAAIVGMFPQAMDQVTANVQYTMEALKR